MADIGSVLKKGHQLYACEKFEVEQDKFNRANLASEDKDDSNESVNELGF